MMMVNRGTQLCPKHLLDHVDPLVNDGQRRWLLSSMRMFISLVNLQMRKQPPPQLLQSPHN